MFGNEGMGGFAAIMMIGWIVPLAAALISIIALWRMMRAQERIVEHLAAIERRMGQP